MDNILLCMERGRVRSRCLQKGGFSNYSCASWWKAKLQAIASWIRDLLPWWHAMATRGAIANYLVPQRRGGRRSDLHWDCGISPTPHKNTALSEAHWIVSHLSTWVHCTCDWWRIVAGLTPSLEQKCSVSDTEQIDKGHWCHHINNTSACG